MVDELKFQHYEVHRDDTGRPVELGRGAMGITYRAFDANLRTDVALKVISGAYLESNLARERFLREARAAARIHHPNVAAVHHLGEDDGSYFYAMELIDGETVDDLIRRSGPLPTLQALLIVHQVARALGAAQKQALVHRDIKPSNIMIVRDDDDLHVKVIDFGLARPADRTECDGEAPTLTLGGFLGTPHFASPEQLDERPLDVRSDIYSLGLTLFYMLSGEIPFTGSLAQIIDQQIRTDPAWEKMGDRPEVVRRLVQRMVAKRPDDRFADPAELRHAIENCLDAVQSIEDAERAEDPSRYSMHPSPTTFVGSTVGDRYVVGREVAPSVLGRVFRARDSKDNREVRLTLTDHDLISSDESRDQLLVELDAIQRVKDPVVLEIIEIVTGPSEVWVVHEGTPGRTLLEELRSRGRLPSAQVADIVQSLAAGLTTIEEAGIRCPSLAPGCILLPEDPLSPVARINLLAADSLSVVSPKVTMVDTFVGRLTNRGAFEGRSSAASACALAHLAYESLGGIHSAVGDDMFIPISGISEAANVLLRRGLDAAAGFENAGQFANQLVTELRHSPETTNEVAPVVRDPQQPKEGPSLPPRPAFQKVAVGTVGIIALLVVLAVIIAMVRNSTDSTSELAASMGIPSPTEAPTPSPSPSPEASPTPSPEEVLNERLALAADQAENGNLQAAFDHVDQAAKALPEHPRLPLAYENISAKLRETSSGAEVAELQNYRDALIRAAGSGSRSAKFMLATIADRIGDAALAFELYREAATLGDPEAMAKTGAALAAGWGTDQDWQAAIEWFEQGAARDDPSSLYALGEIHALGKGTQKDVAKAYEYLRSAAEKYDHPLAKILLGDLYLRGDFGQRNYDEAWRLFSSAAEDGSLNARAKMAVMIYNGEVIDGEPVQRSPRPRQADHEAAFKIWNELADQGNALSLFYRGMVLWNGFGAPQDRDAARKDFILAARRGENLAIAWCRENSIDYEREAQ